MGENSTKKKIFAEGVTHEDLCDMFADLIAQSATNEPLTAEQVILCQFLQRFRTFIAMIDFDSLCHLFNYMFFYSKSSPVVESKNLSDFLGDVLD